MKAFEIKVNGKMRDYRMGQPVDLEDVKNYFAKKYTVRSISMVSRHVVGILEYQGQNYFLKLATTEGMGAITKIEYAWNEQVNKILPREKSNFWVPINFDCGSYDDKLFYLVTDFFDGRLLVEKPAAGLNDRLIREKRSEIIETSEIIQSLNINKLSDDKEEGAQDFFWQKTKSWFEGIPENIREEHGVAKLLEIVKQGYSLLKRCPRHGDFAPWHLMALNNGKLGLIDAEHARRNGVENYDMGYFIQRIFSVLEKPELAKEFFKQVKHRKYNPEKMRVVLAARAIGGYLDESLNPTPDYKFCDEFRDWVVSIGSEE